MRANRYCSIKEEEGGANKKIALSDSGCGATLMPSGTNRSVGCARSSASVAWVDCLQVTAVGALHGRGFCQGDVEGSRSQRLDRSAVFLARRMRATDVERAGSTAWWVARSGNKPCLISGRRMHERAAFGHQPASRQGRAKKKGPTARSAPCEVGKSLEVHNVLVDATADSFRPSTRDYAFRCRIPPALLHFPGRRGPSAPAFAPGLGLGELLRYDHGSVAGCGARTVFAGEAGLIRKRLIASTGSGRFRSLGPSRPATQAGALIP